MSDNCDVWRSMTGVTESRSIVVFTPVCRPDFEFIFNIAAHEPSLSVNAGNTEAAGGACMIIDMVTTLMVST